MSWSVYMSIRGPMIKPNIPKRGIPPRIPRSIISGWIFELLPSNLILNIVSIPIFRISARIIRPIAVIGSLVRK